MTNRSDSLNLADVKFAEDMIFHLRQGIRMAEREIDNGQYQEFVDMARAFIKTQQAEVDRLKRILDKNTPDDEPDTVRRDLYPKKKTPWNVDLRLGLTGLND